MQKRQNDPKKGSEEEVNREKRERNWDLIFASGACIAGFAACYFLLERYGGRVDHRPVVHSTQPPPPSGGIRTGFGNLLNAFKNKSPGK